MDIRQHIQSTSGPAGINNTNLANITSIDTIGKPLNRATSTELETVFKNLEGQLNTVLRGLEQQGDAETQSAQGPENSELKQPAQAEIDHLTDAIKTTQNRQSLVNDFEQSSATSVDKNNKSQQLRQSYISQIGSNYSKVTVGILKEGLATATDDNNKKDLILDYCKTKKEEGTNFLNSADHLLNSNKLSGSDKQIVKDLFKEIVKEIYNPKEMKQAKEEIHGLRTEYNGNKTTLNEKRDQLTLIQHDIDSKRNDFEKSKDNLLEKANQLPESTEKTIGMRMITGSKYDNYDGLAGITSDNQEFEDAKSNYEAKRRELKQSIVGLKTERLDLKEEIKSIKEKIESVETKIQEGYERPSFDESIALKKTTHAKEMQKKYGITITFETATSNKTAEILGQTSERLNEYYKDS